MQDSAPSDLELRMWRRVQRHMLLSILGVIVGITCLGLARFVGVQLFHGEPPPAYFLVYALCVFSIPAIGFASARINLRCPNCDGSVVWQVSGNASKFASMGFQNCRHCGKQIFGRIMQRSFRRTVVIVFVFTILLFSSGAFLGALRH